MGFRGSRVRISPSRPCVPFQHGISERRARARRARGLLPHGCIGGGEVRHDRSRRAAPSPRTARPVSSRSSSRHRCFPTIPPSSRCPRLVPVAGPPAAPAPLASDHRHAGVRCRPRIAGDLVSPSEVACRAARGHGRGGPARPGVAPGRRRARPHPGRSPRRGVRRPPTRSGSSRSVADAGRHEHRAPRPGGRAAAPRRSIIH
jgi:hypothetical protein